MANEYPIPKFHFQVEWGASKIGFTEVTGLNVERDVVEYREGSSKEYSKIKMPGMTTYSDITLKRGSMAKDNDFYNGGFPVNWSLLIGEILLSAF